MSEDDGRNPVVSNVTLSLLFIAMSVGIAVSWLIDMQILGPAETFSWIPVSVLLFVILIRPIVNFSGVNEAITVIMLALLILSYVLVFLSESAVQILVLAFVLTLGGVIFEFPRSFQIGDAEEGEVNFRRLK